MSEKTFNQWAVVELFGHQKMAGRVEELTIGSSTWIRVTVPKTKFQESFDRILHPNAIYAINPVAEDVAKMRAEAMQVAPITKWDLPESIRKMMTQRQEALEMPEPEDED